MRAITDLVHDFSRLFFPHHCAGCGTDVLNRESHLCIRCLHALPLTHFHSYPGNPVEQALRDSLPLVSGTAYCHFTQGAMVQALLHRLKYQRHRALGLMLGRMMGQCLRESDRFSGIDALVPVPLHAARERHRGYNQSAVLCEGMAGAMQVPVLHRALVRLASTDTQTHKNRQERWQNMQGRFRLRDASTIAGRHVLLVDDVMTTGATMHACAHTLLEAAEVRVSVAALAWADD